MKLEAFISEALEGDGETKLTIKLGLDGLTIQPEGMGVYEGDFAPILIERANGKVRLIYWPDINDQEPVIVDMSGALLSNSDLAWQQYKNGSCPDCSTEIPMTAVKGEACENCGHVWAWGPNDDPGSD
jgi:hypothetical protein